MFEDVETYDYDARGNLLIDDTESGYFAYSLVDTWTYDAQDRPSQHDNVFSSTYEVSTRDEWTYGGTCP